MNLLYIGQYTSGTTSKMRADQLKEILNPQRFGIIDTHEPFFKTPKLLRSLGFRYKRGPLVANTNRFIQKQLAGYPHEQFDLIWVDKAVYITKETTVLLRQKAKMLVHFTPDPAFTFHQSHHFKASLDYYDFAITTKSFETEYYQKHLPKEKIILATQGFNSETHQPQIDYLKKEEGVLFIGHCENERELVVQKLIDGGIQVILAGIKWEKFVKRNQSNSLLTYLGKGIYGSDYAKALSSYQFSWGALSKWIPELHTTRTFEIPACGTALITERNDETCGFFNEEEAIFYDSPEEMVERIKYFQNHPDELEALTTKGRERVIRDGRDYRRILEGVLERMGIKG
jgi:glycosyltransferase involved in cell wall biosynthesis